MCEYLDIPTLLGLVRHQTILPAVKKIQKMHSRNGQSGWSDVCDRISVHRSWVDVHALLSARLFQGDWIGLERRILDTALVRSCCLLLLLRST